MFQLMVVHIQHGSHEAELDLLRRPDLAMEENALIQVREVHGHGLIGIANGHLDVSHQRAGFPLDPSADLHEHVGQSCLDIRIESADHPVETDGFASRHLGGVELTH